MIRRLVAYESHGEPESRVEVPSLDVALILTFGPTMRVGEETVSSFLTGMWDGPAPTEHDGEAHGIQIDVPLSVAFSLMGGQMELLSNRVFAVDDLDLDVDRIMETDGAAAEEVLADAVARGPSMSREVSWVCAHLRREPSTRIAAIADEVGWSRGHLVDRFRREVGLSPKRYARIARFQSVIARLGAQPLATVSADCGYADQSHLTHEFRELAGMTPTEYQATFLQDVM